MNAAHELILGGARSGKSRTAEQRAATWLATDTAHRATLIATALPGDDEMAQRIKRHRADRVSRVPALACVEEPRALGDTIQRLSSPGHLLVVDCLTLWLTQCLMPPSGALMQADAWPHHQAALIKAMCDSVSPLVLVSNEIGLGVMPVSREARACVDALGHLHQAVAAHCARVTLMVAGCELHVKGGR